jgi:hypothetical protein
MPTTSITIDWLASADASAVRDWLRNRLEGHDPYHPVDHRADDRLGPFLGE